VYLPGSDTAIWVAIRCHLFGYPEPVPAYLRRVAAQRVPLERLSWAIIDSRATD